MTNIYKVRSFCYAILPILHKLKMVRTFKTIGVRQQVVALTKLMYCK
jgi:hypothetical protein